MGLLLNTLKEFNSNLPLAFKDNTNYFSTSYSKSVSDDKKINAIAKGKMQKGKFYFLHYVDDSNWMQYSPILTVDFKRFNNMIVIQAVNFNFIPLKERALFLDKHLKDLTNNEQLGWVDYKSVYAELIRLGYEYAIVEYNLAMITMVHHIDISIVPRFIYAGHVRVKYDPKKLYQIWSTKLETKAARHNEIIKFMLDDFYKMDEDIKGEFTELKGHIDRVQKNLTKYGNRKF